MPMLLAVSATRAEPLLHVTVDAEFRRRWQVTADRPRGCCARSHSARLPRHYAQEAEGLGAAQLLPTSGAALQCAAECLQLPCVASLSCAGAGEAGSSSPMHLLLQGHFQPQEPSDHGEQVPLLAQAVGNCQEGSCAEHQRAAQERKRRQNRPLGSLAYDSMNAADLGGERARGVDAAFQDWDGKAGGAMGPRGNIVQNGQGLRSRQTNPLCLARIRGRMRNAAIPPSPLCTIPRPSFCFINVCFLDVAGRWTIPVRRPRRGALTRPVPLVHPLLQEVDPAGSCGAGDRNLWPCDLQQLRAPERTPSLLSSPPGREGERGCTPGAACHSGARQHGRRAYRDDLQRHCCWPHCCTPVSSPVRPGVVKAETKKWHAMARRIARRFCRAARQKGVVTQQRQTDLQQPMPGRRASLRSLGCSGTPSAMEVCSTVVVPGHLQWTKLSALLRNPTRQISRRARMSGCCSFPFARRPICLCLSLSLVWIDTESDLPIVVGSAESSPSPSLFAPPNPLPLFLPPNFLFWPEPWRVAGIGRRSRIHSEKMIGTHFSVFLQGLCWVHDQNLSPIPHLHQVGGVCRCLGEQCQGSA